MPNVKLPRGIANKNPGNIRISSSKWKGKLPVEQNTDGVFEQFKAPEWGIRALAILLLGYQENKGANTLRKVFATYAPSNENDTKGYINYVSMKSGIDPDAVLDFDNYDTMTRVIRAIIGMENGEKYYDYYPESVLKEALRLAGIDGTPPKPVVATGEAKAAAAGTGIAALAAVGPVVQAAQPAFPLAQQIITVAPWVIIVAVTLGIAYLAFRLYNKYKTDRL